MKSAIKISDRIAKTPVITLASQPEANPYFDQMTANLAAGIRSYGKTETEGMWTFYQQLDRMLMQVLGSGKTDGFEFYLIQALNTVKPFDWTNNAVPEPLTLSEYAGQLLSVIFDFTGAGNVRCITAETYPAMFDTLDEAIDLLADKLIETNEHHYAELHKRMAALITIREAADPVALLGEVLAAHSSQEV